MSKQKSVNISLSYDVAVLPIFIDKPGERRTLVVGIDCKSVAPEINVDLFARPNEQFDHSDVSDIVLLMLERAFELKGEQQFDEDAVVGDLKLFEVAREEDMVALVCYIAESILLDLKIKCDNVKQVKDTVLAKLTGIFDLE